MLEPSKHRELTEFYKQLYLGEVDDISTVMIDEIVEELLDECLELGYESEEILEAIEYASSEYFDQLELDESTNSYFAAMHKAQNKKRQAERKQEKTEKRKEAVRQAVGKVKSKLAGAAVSAYSAGKAAKEGAKSAAASAKAGAKKAGEAAAGAAEKKKAEVKSGVKKLLGKGLRAASGAAGRVAQAARKAGSAAGKAAERLGEEVLDEKIATGTGKKVMPSAAERSRLATRARAGEDIGKKGKGFKAVAAKAAKRYGSKEAGERVAAAAMFKAQAHEEYSQNIDEAEIMKHQKERDRIEGMKKKASRARTWSYEPPTKGKHGEIERRMAKRPPSKLRSGSLPEGYDVYDLILSYLLDEGFADTHESALAIMVSMGEEWREDILDEAMTSYEKNRKRAAQRAAARNAARDAGQTGAVKGVGYVTPRRERETWTDEKGKTRHAKGL